MTGITEALWLLARAAGADSVSGAFTAPVNADHSFRHTAAELGIRLRRVRLRRHDWWRMDNGPLLVFRDDTPLVLLPRARGGYRTCEPATGHTVTVDRTVAVGLSADAFMPYRRFGVGEFDVRSWLRAARRGGRRDCAAEWVAGAAAGVLQAAPAFGALALASMAASGNRGGLLGVTAALLGLAAAGACFDYVRAIAAVRRRDRADGAAHAALWDRTLALPVDAFRRHPPTDNSERLRIALGAIHLRVAAQSETPRAAGALVAALATMLIASPLLGAMAAAPLLAVCVLGRAIVLKGEGIERVRDRDRPGMMRRLWLLAQFLPEVTLLGAAEWVVGCVQADLRDEAVVVATQAAWQGIGSRLGRNATAPIAVAIYLAAIATGATVGPIGCILLALVPAAEAVGVLARASAAPAQAAQRFIGAAGLLGTPPENRSGAPTIGPIERVELRDVSFTYPGASAPSLRDISLTLARGEIVALAGPSGSGKSTLLHLLMGIEPPTTGAVLVNGTDLQSGDIAGYRARIGAVFQDEEIGLATIRSVILGMAPVPVERAWEAARIARIDDFIRQMPSGMQALVSENLFPAALLSQLLIARALARNPDLVVLDEATIALDETIQAAMLTELRQLGLAVILATHRPSTLDLADRIVRLDCGRLAAT